MKNRLEEWRRDRQIGRGEVEYISLIVELLRRMSFRGHRINSELSAKWELTVLNGCCKKDNNCSVNKSDITNLSNQRLVSLSEAFNTLGHAAQSNRLSQQ